MYVFKPSKFVRTKNVGSGKMLPLNAIPVKTHKILQLEDDLGCLVFYIVIYSMDYPVKLLLTVYCTLYSVQCTVYSTNHGGIYGAAQGGEND